MNLSKPNNENIYNEILSYVYGAQFQKHGATAKGSFWLSHKRQEIRFHIITQEIVRLADGKKPSIVDIGCGYGAFAKYLLEKADLEISNYTGYDICPQLIEECCKLSQSNFIKFKIGSAPISPTMFTIMSGTFNLSATTDIKKWEEYVLSCLQSCWKQTTFAMIFNLQVANRSRISENKIYYADTASMSHACINRFGPTMIILNQEIPKDATFVILRAEKYRNLQQKYPN